MSVVRDSKTLGFPTWLHSGRRLAPGLVEWSLADGAYALRCEEMLQRLPGTPEADEEFFELVTIVYGDEAAQDAMYERLKRRGMNAAAKG